MVDIIHLAEMRKKKPAEILKIMNDAIAFTVHGLHQMAICYTALQELGHDLSEFTNPMFEHFPAVANGTLLPELLWKFGGSPSRLSHLATLNVTDQKKVAVDNAKLPVVQHDGSIKQLSPSAMSMKELTQVVRDGRSLAPHEQQKPAAPKPTPIPKPVEPDQWDKEAFTADEREAILIVAESEDLTSLEFIAHQSRTAKGFVMSDVLKRAAPKRKAVMKKAAPKKRAGINAH